MAAAEVECGCTGVRKCLLCEDKDIPINTLEEDCSKNIRQYKLCIICGDTLPVDEQCTHCKEPGKKESLALEGVTVIQDFVSELEEQTIVKEIDRTIWKPSQSGRRKQVTSVWFFFSFMIRRWY